MATGTIHRQYAPPILNNNRAVRLNDSTGTYLTFTAPISGFYRIRVIPNVANSGVVQITLLNGEVLYDVFSTQGVEPIGLIYLDAGTYNYLTTGGASARLYY